MIVRACDVAPDGLQIDVSPEIGPLSYEGGLEIGVADAALTGKVTPTRDGLQCSGHVRATARVPCARCLEQFDLPVDRGFVVSFVSPDRREEAAELQIGKEDLDVSFLGADGSIDLNMLVAEQVYLEVPLKPLCSPSCPGLCPDCGTNLNSGDCNCMSKARGDAR